MLEVIPKRWCWRLLLAASGLAIICGPNRAVTEELALPFEAAPQESPQRRGAFEPMTGVYKARIVAHWFAGNTRFWYRNDLRDGVKEFIVVDAERGTRQPAFDHEKLAAALGKAADQRVEGQRLPFRAIEFVDEGKAIRFAALGGTWKCDLSSYDCVQSDGPAPKAEDEGDPPQGGRKRGPRRFDGPPGGQGGFSPGPLRSPDGKWTALLKDHNIYLRQHPDGPETALTRDGKAERHYGRLTWSPDSQTLVAFRIEPGDRKEVHLIESSPRGGGRAILRSRPYPLPGDKFTAYAPWLYDVAARKEIPCSVDKIDYESPRIRWNRDGKAFTYEKIDRGHQRFRLIEIEARTGAARNLIDEQSHTFIWTAHAEILNFRSVRWLEKTDEILYASERDGWRRLYLLDAKSGSIKHEITPSGCVLRGIERVDEDARQVWFTASGRNADQDPYFIHHYRVNFDGTGLVALTAGNGTHTVAYSPDRKYLIDTYSRVDQPPVHELRRVSDGGLVCKLEEADISQIRGQGWQPPEVFVAKGRDGKTDIWGIICRPRDFDPAKKYPVIEHIYAGPQGSFVPKSFSPRRRFSELTDLGFIVVQIDGMGTANRSKAFHDVCWKNLKDAGFPDRILWHQAAAKQFPHYDIGRVGIYGGSAGGQNAAAGVLFHPDFYKAAVAGCGCHDNRMDKASWNEQWMGYPVGPQYSACSNIDNAHRLRGKLMLIVGELDDNVPPESTYRFADALIRAGKDFDLVVVPGAGHGMGGAYGQRRLADFFVRHLQGREPPDRNAVETRRVGG